MFRIGNGLHLQAIVSYSFRLRNIPNPKSYREQAFSHGA